jgi:hypothetical protein
MLAAAFLEMIPESLELLHSSPAFILGGYLLVHLFEHGFAPHFHFGEEVHTEELLDPSRRDLCAHRFIVALLF